ncbi:MAG: hypothetical protein IJ889_06010 [Eubacterium sp.]|nr:hypothetical protein [Eubacterium sp.]
MYYEEFTEDIRERVEDLIQEDVPECIVTVRNVVKNNGVKRKALSFVVKDEKATPTIYLREFYEDYREGRDIDDICEEIIDTYKRGLSRFQNEIDVDDFTNYEKVKEQVFLKLVNQEMNQKLLRDVPWREYLDLAVVYYVAVSTDECSATVLIHTEHLEHWGITEKELYDTAWKNTLEKKKPEILRMKDVIKDMIIERITGSTDILAEDVEYDGKTKQEVEEMVNEEIEKVERQKPMDMYILTNDTKTNGAVCMMYPNVLKDFAEDKGFDLFIIPSSIHEVLLVPKKAGSAKRLNEILNDVNKNSLDSVEILSNKIYSYDRKEDNIKIVEV